MVKAVEGAAVWIEPDASQQTFRWSLLDHDLYVMETAAKFLGQPIQDASEFLLDQLTAQW